MEKLKQYRKSLGISQKETAKIVEMPLRTYINYENDSGKEGTLKYDRILEILQRRFLIDEDHGLLTIKQIKENVNDVFTHYNVNFCYLFGSYAKGKANESSDIDLLIDSPVTGLDFYGLVEELRGRLKKRIDLLNVDQLVNNRDLLKEVLKEGVKIYG